MSSTTSVRDTTPTAPTRAVEHTVLDHAAADQPTGAWRSRLVATVAYLLTLAGLLAVASTGTDVPPDPPITQEAVSNG